jgi:hypothetical protein
MHKLLDQFKKIASGTHIAAPIQDPDFKKKTKGRPTTKKDRSTSTKRNPLAFELVEERIKRKSTTRKRALNSTKRKQSKQVKQSGSIKIDEEEVKNEDLGHSSNVWNGSGVTY